MNSAALAQTAYGDARRSAIEPRRVELQAFAAATHRLSAVATGDRRDYPKLAAALHENLRLWTALALDVANAENELPKALRAQIFYLAEFTRTHGRKVMAGEADVAALIDINTAVMRGLRGEAGGD